MPGLHHRNAGPLNAIFENETITAQIISDGHHLHSSTVRYDYINCLVPKDVFVLPMEYRGLVCPKEDIFIMGKSMNLKTVQHVISMVL
jgi:hypothetical protein